MADWIPVVVTGAVGIASIVGMWRTAELNRDAQSTEAERQREYERKQDHSGRRRGAYVEYLRCVDVLHKHLSDIARAVNCGKPSETVGELVETARRDGLLPLIIAQKVLVLEAPGHVSTAASSLVPQKMLDSAKAGTYSTMPGERINEVLEAMREDLGIPAWGAGTK